MHKAHINKQRIQTCDDHLRNVANKAAKSLSDVDLSETAYLSGLCHDIGKYTEEFQEYLQKSAMGENTVKGSVIHSFAGVKLIAENFHPHYNKVPVQRNYEQVTAVTAEMIATAIGCHHGLFDELNENGDSALDYRCNKQPEYDERAINAFLSENGGMKEINTRFQNANKEVDKIVKECTTLAVKNKERKNDCLLFYLSLVQRLLNSAIMDGDREDTAEFMQEISFNDYISQGSTEMWEDALNNLEALIDSFPQETDIQKARRQLSDMCVEAADREGGIYRLRLPTGGGKTLSGLRYALAHAKKFDKKRIVLTVPLLSVLDQNIDVVRQAVGNEGMVLEHHSDVIIDSYSSEELKRYEILTETWDSPIIMTTFVQLLNAMFSGKTAAVRRFHTLCNSVIVIDEVQNVPEKMISLFTLAINFLSKICKSTVILCSATQPKFENNTFSLVADGDIVSPSELAKYNKLFKRTTTNYVGEMSQDEIVEHASKLCDEHGNLLVICNTKKEALNISAGLCSKDVPCIYLSTSLCMAHRKAQLKRITDMLANGEKVVCVSTQLIEAGVDISFSSVIRLSAGIDNITQAAGRCNRHGEKESLAPVDVISLKGEKLSYLKEIDEAKSLTEALAVEYAKNPETYENDLISIPAINYYYTHKFMELNKHIGKAEFPLSDGKSLLELLSGLERDSWMFMKQSYKTAGNAFQVFNDDSRTIVVPYNEDASFIITELYEADSLNDWKKIKRLLKKAKSYTVQVFDNQYKQLYEAGAVIELGEGEIAVLQPGYYDDDTGVIDPQHADVNKIDESYIF